MNLIISNSLNVLLLFSSIYLWKWYFRLKKTHEKIIETYRCHNTVIIYSRRRGISGWPKYNVDPYRIEFKNLSRIFEPITHFITTSEKTVDIAVMTISSSVLINTILNVLRKGIRVRIILNYAHSENVLVKKLIKNGADVIFFVEPSTTCSLFHYKYAIKDYGTNNQAAYCGSINWTDSAFTSNYEDLTISTNKYIVDRFNENFNDSFEYIKNMNKAKT
ncbi:uncharacterized protein [Onthophagus taurus]|uniref:uncharacterized protein n=1 Tax=Onthophagus taurus TaxID=166361 RepID=UPI000C1FDCBF|nr:uncharacterized protein LOC111413766 [Onthophagus taurus]